MNSNKNESRYQELAEKWLNGTITSEGEKEFANWYNAHQETPIIVPSSHVESEAEHKAKIFASIENVINPKDQRVKKAGSFYWLSVAAAITIFLISAGGYFVFTYQQRESRNMVGKTQFKEDVPAGKEKAFLTLADGKVIILEEAQNGLELEQGATKILKLEGSLSYNQGVEGDANEVTFNSVQTPRGGHYQIVLADGSRVWLNAASSIRFPTAFTGKERRVQLTGEAYFEIANNPAMPFKVEAGEVVVKVLGTHFNVMAYHDEKVLETTLVEGSVQVIHAEREQTLFPGQQAVHQYGSNGFKLKKVDTEDITAWKNGEFVFDQADLSQVMRQIQRWYDVEVVYRETIPAVTFTGIIPRKENVSKLLDILELAGGVQFEISGRTVIVYKKEN